MHKKHFFLSNNIAEARGFSPQKQGFDGHTLPSKDRAAQASMVKEQYVAVVNQIVTHLEEREKQQSFKKSSFLFFSLFLSILFFSLSFFP